MLGGCWVAGPAGARAGWVLGALSAFLALPGSPGCLPPPPPLPLGAPAAPASSSCLRPGLVLVTWRGRLCSFSAMACLLLLAAPPALCPAKESRHEHMALWIYLNQGEEVNERAKQNTRKADKQDILTLHPCRPSSCELASISASPLGSYRGLAARSRTSSGESRSHARAGQSRESGTQAARDPRGRRSARKRTKSQAR